MKSSGVGGQAVIEGVMMKNKDQYAIAVRKPNQEIVVEKREYKSLSEKYTVLKLPIIRGVVAFIESMIIGTKTITFSASFFEEEETEPIKQSKGKNADKKKSNTSNVKKADEKSENMKESIFMGLTVLLSVLIAVAIFIMLPFFLSNLLSEHVKSITLRTILEGIIRLLIFIGYVAAISQINDIKRVFMYHGAEHKTINCIEKGFDLTVENVKRQSKEHKRCGTSFMLFVVILSILFFIVIQVEATWLRAVLRLLLIPVIAGVAYEILRLAGRSESKIITVISKPGLLLQGLTTREPDDKMIEVAIQSVEAVFDWKAFQEENTKNETISLKNKRDVIKTEEDLAISISETAAHLEEEDEISEEEDEILKALDKYFVYKDKK